MDKPRKVVRVFWIAAPGRKLSAAIPCFLQSWIVSEIWLTCASDFGAVDIGIWSTLKFTYIELTTHNGIDGKRLRISTFASQSGITPWIWTLRKPIVPLSVNSSRFLLLIT